MFEYFNYLVYLIRKFSRSFLPPHVGQDRLLLGASSNSLSITDNRTGRRYVIPVAHNAVEATQFKQIKVSGYGSYPADQEDGLRLFDPGFHNTAVMESKVTYM